MADEKTYTKAELDAAIESAVGPLKSKLDEVMDEAKDAKRKLRAASEIKPEDMAALENEVDRLKADNVKLTKDAKDAAKAAETATKALEVEQGAARTYALEAELAGAIAEGNVVPALVPALKAMVQQQAKADLVDGKYAVLVGDKSARDYMKSFLESDDGKHFKAAPINGGGGAPGSNGGGGDTKTMPRSEHQKLMVSNPAAANSFVKAGGVVVNDAA